MLPNVYDWQGWLPIDYMKCRSFSVVTTWSVDQIWQVKQAQMQGATMESVYWFHKGENFMKFIHTKWRQKWNKTRTKHHSITIQCNNLHTVIGPMGPYKAWKCMHTDRRVAIKQNAKSTQNDFLLVLTAYCRRYIMGTRPYGTLWLLEY